MSFERLLVDHCSPTLASIKTANLFSFRSDDLEHLKRSMAFMNAILKETGVELILLKSEKDLALIYVYRKKRLREILNRREVFEFLKKYGYESNDADYAVEHLKDRFIQSRKFPHEIGIFLDYPLDDVIGFIQNAGANCKCTGCWKVYCNECEAVKTFAKYKKCSEVYSKLWYSGRRSLLQLTVKN